MNPIEYRQRERLLGVVICLLIIFSMISTVNFLQVEAKNPISYEIKVFDVFLSGKLTIVLTYGQGKFSFLGDHVEAFELDHTYTVTTIKGGITYRYNSNLVIVEMGESDCGCP